MLTLLSGLLAQDDKIDLQKLGQNEESFRGVVGLTIPKLISGLISLTMVVAAIVFFFILVIGGIKWIMSGGDKAQTEAARSQITAALVGLVIVFAAWAIVQLIQVFFGISIFQLSLPSVTQ